MRVFRLLWLAACVFAALLLRAQSLQGIGDGAPSEGLKLAFQFGFTRGSFSNLVTLPPLGTVKRLGSSGLVQEFAGAADASARFALVRASASETATGLQAEVWHVHAPMYAFYLETGPGVAGYPTTDTQSCPALFGACQWQTFDRNYALFVLTGRPAPNSFVTKDAFYTKWVSQGGLNTFGPAVSGEEEVTSGARTGAAAVRQRFAQSEIFSITGGPYAGRVFGVRQPVYAVYSQNLGPAGALGFPISEETITAGNRRRQAFEGGAIEYAQGGEPVLVLPVASVLLSSSSDTLRMKLGDVAEVTASTIAPTGERLTGRAIAWNTSNSRVVAVEPRGDAATLRAVGGGAATITATSEGRVSRGLAVFVTAPCCQPGEGAPTASIQQAFQDALTRTRISVKLPGASPVRRVGEGYIQEFTSPDGGVRYVLAKPDTLGSAFVMTGPILVRHAGLGGFTGAMGYPVADPAANGARQIFQGGALAGNPVQTVTAPILARWAALNYEAGVGLPLAAAESVLSFTATAGVAQSFAGALLAAATTGANAGRVYFVGGAVLAKYLETGGIAGLLGFPVSDEGTAAGRRRQEFEGGAIEVQGGVAQVMERSRTPQITATPGNVAAGGRVRIAAGGFPAGATLRISVSGRPDFTVTTVSGAFAWDLLVPANTPSSLVTLRAVEVDGRGIAAGSFVVQAASETLLRLAKVRGDQQTGLPGARLPQPLRIRLTDEFGGPVAGRAVQFSASPGARIEAASVATNAAGEAEAWLRLPAAESAALATAQAGGQVVTFQARAQASALSNYPRYTQGGTNALLGAGPETVAQKGALLVSAAGALRHLQNTGRVSAVNGPADPESLNAFLKDYCAFDAAGGQICDGFLALAGADRNVNLWRLEAFTGGALEVAPVASNPDAIRDALAQGAPVLLALSLTANGGEAGAHFVAAIGVTASGAILIHDPNPRLARTALEEYESGFTAGPLAWRGALRAAMRLEPRGASTASFLIAGMDAEFEVTSLSGRCGETLAWPAITATGAEALAGAPGTVRFRACSGGDALYQLDVAARGRAPVFTDLGNPGGRMALAAESSASYRLTRAGQSWTAEPMTLTVDAAAVVNAASFTNDLSPGAIVSVFGGGLSGPGADTAVEIGGRAAKVLAAYPFQLNFAVPADLAPGEQPLILQSAYGRRELLVDLKPFAPAVFQVGPGRPAVLNQNGTLNTEAQPELRGRAIVVYGTGFGPTVRRGNLDHTVVPVTASLGGRDVVVTYAGLAPGYEGLYQINLIVGTDLAPGSGIPLRLRIGEGDAQAVPVSIQ